MELYKEILTHMLTTEQIQINFQCNAPAITNIVNDKCYEALQKIKTIIKDDSLSDKECFLKIEEIICVLEDLGSNGGNRHDF